MTLTVLETITDPGRAGRANEDGHGSAGDFVWVIDGATGLGDTQLLGGSSDAAWLSGAMDQAFRSHAGTAKDPHTLLQMAAAETEARFFKERQRAPAERYEIPTAAVLVAQFGPAHVDVADLGDCAIHIRTSGGISRFGGSAEGRALEQDNAKRLMAGGGGRGPHVIAFLREVRNKANMPGGYAIFAPEAGSADAARVSRHPFTGPLDALMMTDGFEAAIDDYDLYGSAALMDAAAGGLAGPLGALRALEQADPDCKKYPRFKMSDDATAVYLRYGSIQAE